MCATISGIKIRSHAYGLSKRVNLCWIGGFKTKNCG